MGDEERSFLTRAAAVRLEGVEENLIRTVVETVTVSVGVPGEILMVSISTVVGDNCSEEGEGRSTCESMTDSVPRSHPANIRRKRTTNAALVHRIAWAHAEGAVRRG
jgi:hypothetical protein